MNTDFAKLLNNCLNRIDDQDEVTDRNDYGSEVASEKIKNLYITTATPLNQRSKTSLKKN